MPAQIVYDNVAEGADLHGDLFAGLKFWVAQRVPHRNELLESIRSNGGEVVALEKTADHLIADHFRKDCPPGSIGYLFIENSIKGGELLDPAAFRINTATRNQRATGLPGQQNKETRTPFTAADDRILIEWVQKMEAGGSGPCLTSGNEIYKQLAVLHPHHTWQSWRDRYVKRLRGTPAPPRRSQTTRIPQNPSQSYIRGLTALFSESDTEDLHNGAEHIGPLEGKEYLDAWEKLAESKANQTAHQWRQYFELVVLPQWQSENRKKAKPTKSGQQYGSDGNQSDKNEQPRPKRKSVEESEEDKYSPNPKTTGSQRKRKGDDLERDYGFERWLEKNSKGKFTPAYIRFAEGKKHELWKKDPELGYAELHVKLLDQWRSLSTKEKSLYSATETNGSGESQKRTKTLSSWVGLPSSPGRDVAPRPKKERLEPLRRDEVEEEEGDGDEGGERGRAGEAEDKSPRPTHHSKGTEKHPMPISSLEPPSDLDEDEADPSELDIDDFPPHRAAPGLETQDILSSPIQTASLDALPIASNLTQLLELQTAEDGPAGHDRDVSPDSELASNASTTDSMEEFRRVDGAGAAGDDDGTYSASDLSKSKSKSRKQRSPSVESSSSSALSGDPDPPLTSEEVESFFEEQRKKGFSADTIASALQRTRWRPELAIEVLLAWEVEDVLPDERGIWGEDDDADVESGDGAALERLARKHTLDGWGGVTERCHFLAETRKVLGR